MTMAASCRRTTARKLWRATCMLSVPVFMLAGCSGPMAESGVRIGDETLRQFKAGSTSEAWLVALLGPPTGCSVVKDVSDTKVFRYETVERSSGILAAVTGGTQRNVAVTYFIISDGMVTRFWADRAKETSLLGGAVETDPGAKKAP
jgi:hypothetical protein